MPTSKAASFSTDQLSSSVVSVSPKKRIFTLPWHIALKGLVCGVLVSGVVALGAYLLDAGQNGSLLDTSGSGFQSEWLSLLMIAVIAIAVLFCGIGLPILMLRGARLRHYVFMFAAEFVAIAFVLVVVFNTSNSQPTDNSGGCSGGDLCIEPGINQGSNL